MKSLARRLSVFVHVAVAIVCWIGTADVYAIDAVAKVCLHVVDQDGISVSDAKIWGGFTCGSRMNDYVLIEGKTNTNGVYVAEGRCNEFLRIDVSKDGYYHTEEKIVFDQTKSTPAIVDDRWQPYGEMRKVVLKKIQDPWRVKVVSEDRCHRSIPVFGQWLPFDMELSDWLPPHGQGVHDDVLLRFVKKTTSRWDEFSFSMEACFTNNPCAGVYRRTCEVSSDLKTDYVADTNADYKPYYRFSIESVPGYPVKINRLEKDEYLVFRTRTRINEHGNLIGAHYGKYCGGWRSDEKNVYFGDGCFNPFENDPNIEGDRTLRYAIRSYHGGK